MKALRTSNQFDKDLLLAESRGLDLAKLRAVVDKLLAGEQLPAANQDHKLKGKWKDFRDCHIEPDWLLIYKAEKDAITLTRTGTHSDLF
jgi:mRNA interferase YafQ